MPPTRNHRLTNHGCPTPPKRKLPLKQTNPLPTGKEKTMMTPSKMVPTMVVPTMMALRTIRTPRRVGGADRPATPLCVHQNRCGSHILWSRTNMRSRVGRTPAPRHVRSEATLSNWDARRRPARERIYQTPPASACHRVESHGRSATRQSFFEPAPRGSCVKNKRHHVRSAQHC